MHLIGASQGGVSENMEILSCQGSNVEKQRVRINSWVASYEENGGMCPKKKGNIRKSEDIKKGS